MATSYLPSLSLEEKIKYVLTALKKASVDEVVMEIMELDGISTEGGVEELTMETEKEMLKLYEEEKVKKLREHRQKIRYTLE